MTGHPPHRLAVGTANYQVRDLEARVEVLSADKEDRVELMTLLIRNLLKENKELREMLKSMASFVGEGECAARVSCT